RAVEPLGKFGRPRGWVDAGGTQAPEGASVTRMSVALRGLRSILLIGGFGLLASCRAGVPNTAPYADGECRGDATCIETCERAQSDPARMGRCSELREQAGRSMDDNGPAIADVTEPAAEWSNSGAERSERPLAPSVLYARALASIVSIRTDTGSGSGFAVSAKGVIATNVHVLAGARKIEVFLMNGTKLQLKPAIAIDEEHDLAALQVTQQLPPLALARDDRIVLGQKVVVIGNPLGLEATLSEGLVSGVRKLNKDSRALQITAPISPGS